MEIKIMAGPAKDVLGSLALGPMGATIGAAGTALTKALTPDMPEIEEAKVAPVAGGIAQRIGMERKAQRKYAGKGYEGTALARRTTLG
jgi:hypothetical protein